MPRKAILGMPGFSLGVPAQVVLRIGRNADLLPPVGGPGRSLAARLMGKDAGDPPFYGRQDVDQSSWVSRGRTHIPPTLLRHGKDRPEFSRCQLELKAPNPRAVGSPVRDDVDAVDLLQSAAPEPEMSGDISQTCLSRSGRC
jgi:hypothetical protein